jgi:hypothetical protein
MLDAALEIVEAVGDRALRTVGFQPDRHLNALDGHKRLFLRSEERALTLDGPVDRLEIC